MKPLDVGKTLDRVRIADPSKRTALVQEAIGARVDVGPKLLVRNIGRGAARNSRWNREAAAELHRRALLLSALSAEKVWP